MRAAFDKYMSSEVVEEIMRNPRAIKLGGKKEISILFSDIAGFTTISEKMSPEDLVALLNRYLSAMTTIIKTTHRGNVNKYLGTVSWRSSGHRSTIRRMPHWPVMPRWTARLNWPDSAGSGCRKGCRRSVPGSASTPVPASSATWGPRAHGIYGDGRQRQSGVASLEGRANITIR